MLRDLQSSTKIKEHITELNISFDKSINKEILDEHISFWKNKLELKIKLEQELKKQ
tara:strand:+ start:224 stop:391 length:168 start_codon:yes stop_codon:yes gene_type:complete